MSQNKLILDHLEKGASITPIDALNNFGCFRLAAVIHVLKKDGMNILSHIHTHGGKKYAVYEHVPEGDVKKPESNWMMPEWG